MTTGEASSDKPWWGEQVNDWRKKSGLTCSFVIFAALNIGMMVVGIESIRRCPIQPMIPNYLIVAGSTSLSLLLVRLVVTHILVPYLEGSTTSNAVNTLGESQAGSSSTSEDKSTHAALVLRALNVYDSLASIFSTCWLVVGSVYVYGSHPNHADPLSKDYCDYSAYMFAFIVVTIGYISLFLSIVAAIAHCCCRSK